ncbi:hypothetical protein K6119_08135 [Paracrocinitomix mangrovi]|uniref:hypothetical protein n=1 Tax=Paracrocinitomix mangrovi TaxID=2862509 RepID=UPI001C8D800D|nr:hypothetical protein [Paracrocinitomix mangrovi]UKN03481.1 hypothetical protein K6119_08135 [Paracrocinitomix mangrovi]
MNLIGTNNTWKIYWSDYHNIFEESIPSDTWVCMFIANSEPDWKQFEQFINKALSFGIVDFKSNGKYAEQLHDYFDFHLVDLNLEIEEKDWTEVMTTWHTNETVADTFWQTLNIACLPDHHSYQDVKVLCSDLDGLNREDELANYLQKFKEGWLPK